MLLLVFSSWNKILILILESYPAPLACSSYILIFVITQPSVEPSLSASHATADSEVVVLLLTEESRTRQSIVWEDENNNNNKRNLTGGRKRNRKSSYTTVRFTYFVACLQNRFWLQLDVKSFIIGFVVSRPLRWFFFILPIAHLIIWNHFSFVSIFVIGVFFFVEKLRKKSGSSTFGNRSWSFT